MTEPVIVHGEIEVTTRKILRKISLILPEVALPVTNSLSIGRLATMPPVTDKEFIRKYSTDTAIAFRQAPVLFAETSGSTGPPLPTPRSKVDFEWNTINQMKAYGMHLAANADRVVLLHPSVLSPFIEASAHALHRLGIGHMRVFPIQGLCDYERIFDAIRSFGITAIMSTPTLIYKLFYEFIARFGRLPETLQKVLITGEHHSRSMLENLKRILGSASYISPFVYGSSETATCMIGRPDGLYEGLTSDFLFEVSRHKCSLSNHECKRTHEVDTLKVTWLNEGLMPILRYDTEDIVRVINRRDQYLFEFGGRLGDLVDHAVKEGVLEILNSASIPIFHMRGVLDRVNERCEIDVVTNPNVSTDECKSIQALTGQLSDILQLDTQLSINRSALNFYNFHSSTKSASFVSV